MSDNFPGCVIPTQHTAEAVAHQRHQVCCQNVYPYIVKDSALSSGNLHGQDCGVIIREGALSSGNVHGQDCGVIIREGAA